MKKVINVRKDRSLAEMAALYLTSQKILKRVDPSIILFGAALGAGDLDITKDHPDFESEYKKEMEEQAKHNITHDSIKKDLIEQGYIVNDKMYQFNLYMKGLKQRMLERLDTLMRTGGLLALIGVLSFGCSKQVDHTKYFDNLTIPNWRIPNELKVIEPPDDWKTLNPTIEA